MWPHAVIVEEWLRALARSQRARAGRAGALALALALPLAWVSAPEEAPKPTAPYVQQQPQVGPPALDNSDVYLGFRPRIERPPGARSPLLKPRTPFRPRYQTPAPVEWVREAPAQRFFESRFAASGAPVGVVGVAADTRRPPAAPPSPLAGPARLSLPPAPPPRRADPDLDPDTAAPPLIAEAAPARPESGGAPAPPAAPSPEHTPRRVAIAGPAPAPVAAGDASSKQNPQPVNPAWAAAAPGPAADASSPAASASEAAVLAPLNGIAAASSDGAPAGDRFVVRGEQQVEGLMSFFEHRPDPGAIYVDPQAQLGGNGVLAGDVTIAGLLSPGHSPGVIQVMGDYFQEPTGVLDIELGGTGPEQYDRLLVEGTLELTGTVNVALIDGFVPRAGDQFEVARASTVAVELAHFNFPEFADGNRFAAMVNVDPTGEALQVQTLSTGFQISAIPEPSTGVLLMFGMAGLAWIGRRR